MIFFPHVLLCFFVLVGCSREGGSLPLSKNQKIAYSPPSETLEAESFSEFAPSTLLMVPGYTQFYPAKHLKVFEKRYRFAPQQEATLIYSFKMREGFEFVKGGKLPGLGGGTATTGCDPVDPEGWSMRFMWHRKGKAVIYAYHQDRENYCGDNWDIGSFTIGTRHTLQQYIRINSPGRKDGILKVWQDGVLVLSRSDVRYRGNVSTNTALVDRFLRSTFYGGSDISWAPSKVTSIDFGDFRVFAGSPDKMN